MFWTDNDIKTYINNQSLDIINTFNELDKNFLRFKMNESKLSQRPHSSRTDINLGVRMR